MEKQKNEMDKTKKAKDTVFIMIKDIKDVISEIIEEINSRDSAILNIKNIAATLDESC